MAGGVEEDRAGAISWFIVGISKRRRPRALEPLVPPDDDEPPDAAAVRPLPPEDEVLLAVDVGAEAGAMELVRTEETDEMVLRLLC